MRKLIVACAALMVFGIPHTADAADPTCITLLSTASTKGALKDCGCPKNPLGGLARRATLVSEAPESSILVDAGNWADAGPSPSLAKSRLVWEAMARMGYRVVTPGSGDLIFGEKDLYSLYASQPDIQVVSANVRDSEGRLLGAAYQLIEVNGVTLAVTGVTDESGYQFNVTRGKQKQDSFSFDDPASALKELLPEMRARADLVVLLASMPPRETQELVQGLEGLDAVIVGQNPRYTAQPEALGNTLVVNGGTKGKYLSRLNLCVASDGALIDFSGQGLEVRPEVGEDAAIAAMVEAWEAEHGLEAGGR